jgi:hypothetical protein
VIVNRLWQHHFGEGIVRTPSNFGKLGERPTNLGLLDWLASELVQRGWSLKHIHRLIMTSSTYRQSSTARPDTLAKDPDNRLFGRMNRQRLESEGIRDNLLAVSGELDSTIGGPAIRDRSTKRRALYVITVRSDRTGFGPLFDTADSTNIVAQRTVSTVAPQSLYMMNNPFIIERTKSLAARILKDATSDDASRIRLAYVLLYGRPASNPEIKIGEGFLARARKQPSERIAGSGAPDMELRAWTEYCQILLCANEFIYVD